MYQIWTKTDKACPRYHTFSKIKMAAQNEKQTAMDMCPNMYIVCTKFERKLTKHVQDTIHFQKSRWLPVAIFAQIVKRIVMWWQQLANCHGHVHLYLNMCTKFERKLKACPRYHTVSKKDGCQSAIFHLIVK